MVKSKRRRKSPMAEEGIRCHGFFRLKIVEDGEGGRPRVVGDSGWHKNTIVNEGFRNYLARLLGAIASSSQVTYAALGTGTAPGVTDTTLNGELGDAAGCRCAVSAATSSTSKAVSFTFTLNSGVVTSTRNISNVGLFATSTTQVGTIFAGNTYASSALATNQAVNGTYSISFT